MVLPARYCPSDVIHTYLWHYINIFDKFLILDWCQIKRDHAATHNPSHNLIYNKEKNYKRLTENKWNK
jgi:hypothetical protein